jgi:hypothetical protein
LALSAGLPQSGVTEPFHIPVGPERSVGVEQAIELRGVGIGVRVCGFINLEHHNGAGKLHIYFGPLRLGPRIVEMTFVEGLVAGELPWRILRLTKTIHGETGSRGHIGSGDDFARVLQILRSRRAGSKRDQKHKGQSSVLHSAFFNNSGGQAIGAMPQNRI